MAALGVIYAVVILSALYQFNRLMWHDDWRE